MKRIFLLNSRIVAQHKSKGKINAKSLFNEKYPWWGAFSFLIQCRERGELNITNELLCFHCHLQQGAQALKGVSLSFLFLFILLIHQLSHSFRINDKHNST